MINLKEILDAIEKVTNLAVAADNGVSICRNPHDNANTLSNSGQITLIATALLSKTIQL